MPTWWSRLRERFGARASGASAAALSDTVTVDDTGVRRRLADGRSEAVTWAGLVRVELACTDEGPFAEDQYWLLFSATGGCAIAGSAPAAPALLEHLQALPGFDNETLIQAMACIDNARFVLWQRPDDPNGAAKPLA